MTIKVKINGGFGNQLFQYFFARSLNIKFRCNVILDASDFEKNNKSRFLNIQNLDLKLPIITKKEYFKNFFSSKRDEKGSFLYESDIFVKKYNIYSGFWQSYKYFIDNWSSFKNEINFEKFNTEPEILKKIINSDSISVHIRRGDYVNNPKTLAVHGNLKLDYYKNAIYLIKQQVKNPTFFFFSDDIEWVKNNFHDKNFFFIENDYDSLRLPFKDLLLMKSCKHNIIANSTFSWWGAWFNENPDKIIFAPEFWTSKIKTIDTDLVPIEWKIL